MTKAQMLHRVVMEARVHPNGMIEIPPDLWNEVCEAGAKLTLGECRKGDVVRIEGKSQDFLIGYIDPENQIVYTACGCDFHSERGVTDVIRYA